MSKQSWAYPTSKMAVTSELCHLHVPAQQNLRVLKAMDFEPSGPFITSMLELKLDVNAVFEW